jgi:hypothetical protein
MHITFIDKCTLVFDKCAEASNNKPRSQVKDPLQVSLANVQRCASNDEPRLIGNETVKPQFYSGSVPTNVGGGITRVGQNRIYTLYVTVSMVISLLKIPYVHCIYVQMYGSGQP